MSSMEVTPPPPSDHDAVNDVVDEQMNDDDDDDDDEDGARVCVCSTNGTGSTTSIVVDTSFESIQWFLLGQNPHPHHQQQQQQQHHQGNNNNNNNNNNNDMDDHTRLSRILQSPPTPHCLSSLSNTSLSAKGRPNINTNTNRSNVTVTNAASAPATRRSTGTGDTIISMDLPIDIVDIDDDDDMSSIMSDVGLLEEIDFQWSDQTANHFYTHIAPRLDNSGTVTTNNKDQDGPTTNPHPTPSDQLQQQQQRRRRRRNDRKRQLQLLLREQHALEQKCQERRDYLQRIQPHYPARLLQSIQQRQELASNGQRQVIRQDIASYQTAATTNDPHPHHQSGHSHWFQQMTQTFLFEYHLTGPAAMAVLLHSIIFITLYDLIHDLVLVLYTDLLPGLYHWTSGVWSEHGISLRRWLLPPSITFGPVVVLNKFITPWLETHVDSLFYITMFGVGVYGIHQSGYLYWWLSDYDYTILKFDTHNRIRLWLWRSHIPVDPTRIPVAASATSSTTSDTTIGTTRTTNNPCITSTATVAWWNVPNNNYQNIPNSFVRQFHHVRQYPILRLVLYVTGYYIVYMISQVLVATTYPYFSQHDQILPHLPSLTFDKRLYHLVDNERHSIDDVRSDRQRDVSPCAVQNCRMEMERQLRANQELIRAEHHYTKSRLAHLSYLGYWSTFLEQYGEKSIYPLFDTIQNGFYTVDDGDDEEDEEEEKEDVKETDTPLRDDEPIRRNHTGTIVDFQSTPVFDNTGEIVFAFVSLTIGIALLRGYGFVFWEKY